MTKYKEGDYVQFSAIDEFTGREYSVVGRIVGRANELCNPEWSEAPDDIYVVYSDRLNRRLVVNEFEIED